jgi:hypothetical protein
MNQRKTLLGDDGSAAAMLSEMTSFILSSFSN